MIITAVCHCGLKYQYDPKKEKMDRCLSCQEEARRDLKLHNFLGLDFREYERRHQRKQKADRRKRLANSLGILEATKG